MKRFAALMGTFLLPACATMYEGPSQSVTFESEPQGALCDIRRVNDLIATIPTPSSLYLAKSKQDLTVTCRKPGYQTVTYVQPSQIDATTFAGGSSGITVDAITGAANRYSPMIRITMVPNGY